MPSITKIHSFDEVFDSQRLFRRILTAMSNPGRSVSIKEFAGKLWGENPAMLAFAITLLDNEVGYCVLEDADLSEEIAFLTLSRKENAERADYIFITESALLEDAIKKAKRGTPQDPHKSATLIIKVSDSGAYELRLKGPGIKGAVSLMVPRIVREAIEMRDAENYEYPQGVDFVFVSDAGELLSVPRLIVREAY